MVSFQRSAWSGTSLVTLLIALLALAVGHTPAVADATPAKAAAGLSVAGSVTPVSAGTPAWISAEADFLSGRKLSVVCAASIDEWAQALSGVGFPPGHAQEYYGFSLIREGVMYLSPYVCEGLRLGAGASTRRPNELQVAWSVDVLVHESGTLAATRSTRR